MTVPCEWEVPGNDFGDRSMRIASAISGRAHELIQATVPDLLQFFPFEKPFHFHAHFEPGWFGLRVVYPPRASMSVGPTMKDEDIAYLKSKIEPYRQLDYKALKDVLGSNWYAEDRFTYVGSCNDNKVVSWQNIERQLIEWMEEVSIPAVLERNRTRVLRAIPEPPSYDTASIDRSLWVLECEETNQQGTAFVLEDVGLVTCAHVLGTATYAFRHDNPAQKFPVTVNANHDVIDLAILSISDVETVPLLPGDPSGISQMDHILVAGHPNYRIGDSPFFIPGLVVGFWPVSGIRRLLTNAAIVRGNSGGPVLDRNGRVIGVAVTGGDDFRTQGQTEDHGIVPIDALDLIGG